MEEKYKDSLLKFYQTLFNNLSSQKKPEGNSILLTFFGITSNTAGDLLRRSSFKSFSFAPDVISFLSDNEYIRQGDAVGDYVITAKGIWEIETSSNQLNISMLLNHLDEKYFNIAKYADKPLPDKVKVILFTMIAIRSFSPETPIDLLSSQKAKETIKETVDETYMILKKLNIIKKLDQNDLYGKPGNEISVVNLVRHSDQISKLVRGLFKAKGDQKYFLDIFKDGSISKDNLKYLFKRILDETILDSVIIDELANFCCRIAHEKSIYIYDDLKKYIFSKASYDDTIKDTLLVL
jgi:hypothetical protein